MTMAKKKQQRSFVLFSGCCCVDVFAGARYLFGHHWRCRSRWSFVLELFSAVLLRERVELQQQISFFNYSSRMMFAVVDRSPFRHTTDIIRLKSVECVFNMSSVHDVKIKLRRSTLEIVDDRLKIPVFSDSRFSLSIFFSLFFTILRRCWGLLRKERKENGEKNIFRLTMIVLFKNYLRSTE